MSTCGFIKNMCWVTIIHKVEEPGFPASRKTQLLRYPISGWERREVTSISFLQEVWTLIGIPLSPRGAPSFPQNLDVQNTQEMSPAFAEMHKQSGSRIPCVIPLQLFGLTQ